MGQELYTVKGNAHASSDLAVRRAMGLRLVLFCTVFGDGTISGMTVDQQDAKNKGLIFFKKYKPAQTELGINDKLPKIAAKMTQTQIAEATAFAQKWKDTHPPLSFFPDKLGD